MPIPETSTSDAASRADNALEEFKLLRGEIELRGSEQRTMERVVVLADAAIYNLMVFNGKAHGEMVSLVPVVWFLPPLIGSLALVRWRESVIMIETLAHYLRHQEQRLLPPGQGWESFLHKHVRASGEHRAFSRFYYAFWIILIGATAGLGVYETLHKPEAEFRSDPGILWALIVATIWSAGVIFMLLKRSKLPEA